MIFRSNNRVYINICRIKIQIYFYVYGSYINSYILPDNSGREYLINYKLISFRIINYICTSNMYIGECFM
jgi:hypothetical protein